MPTKVQIKNNSSIKIEGDFELVDQNGNKFDLAGKKSVSLCRCGYTKDKPFCDKSHREMCYNSIIIARKVPATKPKV
ncbi:MAG: CDGSH iron-sulfur domain-containing protein [Bacteroidota bacterium]